MSSDLRLQRNDEPARLAESRPSSRDSDRDICTASLSSSSTVHPEEVTIRCPGDVACLAFFANARHGVSGSLGGYIRHFKWVDNPSEVDTAIDAGDSVYSVAVSRDGKWIASGTSNGRVQVWDAETQDKAREIRAHVWPVSALDVSRDATKIASGSDDAASVWSLSTGDRLLGPWERVLAVKFSPDGRLVATATRTSVRVYDEDGNCVLDVAGVQVCSWRNHTLAWSIDGHRLFALSPSGNIQCLDASAGTILAKWAVHNTTGARTRCIALASNGTFIAALAGSSLSFWDTTTHEQVGSVVELNHEVLTLAISDDYHLATSGGQVISLRSLENLLPSSYLVDTRDAGDNDERLEKIIQHLRGELADAQRDVDEQEARNNLLLSHETEQSDEISQLNEANEKLHNDLAVSSSQITQNQERHEEETDALQSQIEQWKSSCATKEGELATARETLEELHHELENVPPPPSPQAPYEMQPNVHYGVACALPVDTENEEHVKRKEDWETDPTGEYYVPGYFESKVRVGKDREEKQFRNAFSLIKSDPADCTGQPVRIMCYRGTLSDPKWLDEDEFSFSVLCTIKVDLSEASKNLVIRKDDSGKVYYQLDYDLVVSFGRTEIRAEVCWISGTGERRIPAKITFSED